MRAWLALFFAVTACGGATEGVGRACDDGTACNSGATAACITPWPGGYCTEFECAAASCPSGSICVSGFSFQDVSFDAFCLATCEKHEDCRDGYRCADVSRPEKVCAPENP